MGWTEDELPVVAVGLTAVRLGRAGSSGSSAGLIVVVIVVVSFSGGGSNSLRDNGAQSGASTLAVVVVTMGLAAIRLSRRGSQRSGSGSVGVLILIMVILIVVVRLGGGSSGRRSHDGAESRAGTLAVVVVAVRFAAVGLGGRGGQSLGEGGGEEA